MLHVNIQRLDQFTDLLKRHFEFIVLPKFYSPFDDSFC